jgi:hypothetical protein
MAATAATAAADAMDGPGSDLLDVAPSDAAPRVEEVLPPSLAGAAADSGGDSANAARLGGAGGGGSGGNVRYRDPLVLLREATIAKRKVSYADDHLEMEGCRLHRNTKCGFRLTPNSPLVDVGSVWHMFHEISAGDRSYTQDLAKKRGFTYIGVAVRSDLVDYILGRVEKCPGLVMDVISGRKRPKGSEQEALAIPLQKRAKVELATADDQQRGADDDGVTRASGFDVEEITYADVIKRVRPVKDLDVLVRCPQKQIPNADLILRIALEESKNWHGQPAGKAPLSSPVSIGKVPLYQELEQFLVQDKTAFPIILLPCNKNAPVNLLNAHSFFQKGIFEKPDEEHMRFFESTRPEAILVSRNLFGKVDF